MEQPNLILITSHDSGQHLNCYGVDTVHTPNLDRLAGEGVRFANSFCSAPQCSPSRASIATGRYPHSNGVMGLTQGGFAFNMDDAEKTMAEYLRDSGYHTVLGSYIHYCRRNLEGMGFAEHLRVGGLAPEMCSKVGDWLREQSSPSKPFFLHLAITEAHRMAPSESFGHCADTSKGITVPEYLVNDFGAREEFALFQGAIRALDEGVGMLMDAVEAAGQTENTWFIFCADHGIPFARAKCTLYDPGTAVACLMRWPGGFALPAGSVPEDLVNNVDYLPTILEMLGQPVPEAVQGRSHAPLLKGEEYTPADAVFTEMTYHTYYDPIRAVRTGTHKLIVNFTAAPAFMESSNSYRPKCSPKVPEDPSASQHPVVELYDLEADPWEQTNLADSEGHISIRQALLKQLHEWMVRTEDPILNGIPLSPTHNLATHALATGEVLQDPGQLPKTQAI